MKNLFFILLAFSFFTSSAQENRFGIGVMAGVPTGMNSRIYFEGMNALDIGIGHAFAGKNEKVHLYFDNVWINKNFFQNDSPFSIFYGIGGRVKTFDIGDNSFAARIIGGVNLNPIDSRFEFFLEAVPTIDLIPTSKFDFDGAIGLRYFF